MSTVVFYTYQCSYLQYSIITSIWIQSSLFTFHLQTALPLLFIKYVAHIHMFYSKIHNSSQTQPFDLLFTRKFIIIICIIFKTFSCHIIWYFLHNPFNKPKISEISSFFSYFSYSTSFIHLITLSISFSIPLSIFWYHICQWYIIFYVCYDCPPC